MLKQNQRTQFRLRCDVNLAYSSNLNSSFANSLKNSYQIKWYKLDPVNLIVLKDFKEKTNLNENDQDLDENESSPDATLTSIYASDIANESSAPVPLKIASNLIFKLKHTNNYLNKANGIYLCKLDKKLNQITNTTESNFMPPEHMFYQYVQKISINGQ